MPAAPASDGEPSCSPRLRRDAQANREALLAAAQARFAADGLDASLVQVAKDAGLAIGTLYRHFPTRLDLIQALFAEKLQRWLEAAERADARDDAWQGFVAFIEAMCQLQANDQGFNDLLSMRLPEAAGLGASQDRIGEIAARIVGRAQEQGRLRQGLTSASTSYSPCPRPKRPASAPVSPASVKSRPASSAALKSRAACGRTSPVR